MPLARSRFLTTVAVLVATTACVSADDPGVSIDSIEADVVFGIEEEEEALPANTAPGPVPPAALEESFDIGEFRNPAADRRGRASGRRHHLRRGRRGRLPVAAERHPDHAEPGRRCADQPGDHGLRAPDHPQRPAVRRRL